jgi:hypothetical protein
MHGIDHRASFLDTRRRDRFLAIGPGIVAGDVPVGERGTPRPRVKGKRSVLHYNRRGGHYFMPLPFPGRTFFCAAVLGLAGLCGSAFGQEPSISQGQSRLAEIDSQLRRGEWLPARDAAASIIEASRANLVASEVAGAIARLALAEAGMGEEDAAIWHWHVAQSLDGTVLSPDALATFGLPGELLARNPRRQRGAIPAGSVLDSDDPQVRPGVRTQGTVPTLSAEVAALPAPMTLRFQIVVGDDGRPRDPVVVDGGPPGMIWELLEGVRGWRYLPARKGGKAVAVTRYVAVNTPAASPPFRTHFEVQRVGIERLLRSGRWQEAQESARGLWNQMLNWPPIHPENLGMVLTLRALAEAGLGKKEEAVCRWQAAHVLNPSLGNVDLSPYGDAGKLLAASRWADETPVQSEGAVTIEKQRKADVPRASRLINLKGTVTLAAIVGPDGGIRQIRWLQTESQGKVILKGLQIASTPVSPDLEIASRLMTLSALDSVCDWQVRANGSALVETVLTVPFKVVPSIVRVTQPAIAGQTWDPASVPKHYPHPSPTDVAGSPGVRKPPTLP